MEIRTESTLANSKAFRMVVTNYIDLLNAGHSTDWMSLSNGDRVTYAIDGDTVAAAVVWSIHKHMRHAYTVLSVTSSEYRRRGLQKDIHAEVERQARKEGCVLIHSYVHVNNSPMKEGFEKMGKAPTFVRTTKRLTN